MTKLGFKRAFVFQVHDSRPLQPFAVRLTVLCTGTLCKRGIGVNRRPLFVGGWDAFFDEWIGGEVGGGVFLYLQISLGSVRFFSFHFAARQTVVRGMKNNSRMHG